MNNKLFKFSAAILLCLAVTISTFAQKNRGVDVVNLNVTIDDTVSQGLFGIGSYGGSTYFHGLNLVEAQFLSSGVLSFKSGNRFVNAFYSTPEEMTSNSLPAMDSKTNVKFITFVGSQYLQTMAIGEVRCEGLVVSLPSADYTRQIGYRAGRGTITNTGYVKVTHPDNITWYMESNSGGTCGSYDNIARIRDAKNSGKPVPDIDYGRYTMPFKLILTRQ
jgi:outer membrane lipoprotein-sorting protein